MRKLLELDDLVTRLGLPAVREIFARLRCLRERVRRPRCSEQRGRALQWHVRPIGDERPSCESLLVLGELGRERGDLLVQSQRVAASKGSASSAMPARR